MKPALVLGLALAANAMTVDQGDNELIIAPTDQFGNIKPYPGHIRYDEQADDELLVRPLVPHVTADDELLVRPIQPTYIQVVDDELVAVNETREEPKASEAYKRYLYGNLYKPQTTQPREDPKASEAYKRFLYGNLGKADDELIIAPTDEFSRIKPYPRNIRFDEQVDDELIIAPTDEFGRIKHYPPYIKFDEDGNEFFVAPTHRLGDIGHRILYDNELATRAGEVKALLERGFEYKGRLDDEVDAELMMAPLDGTGKYNRRRFDDLTTRKVYDDEGDTELMMSPFRRRFDDPEGRQVYDDEADAELMMAPLDGTGKYNRRRFDDLTTRKVYDDELFRAQVERTGVKQFPGHIMYDEQADDEFFMKPISSEESHNVRHLLFDERRKPKGLSNDDELMIRPVPYQPNYRPEDPGMGPTLFVNRPQFVRKDDEGDNELMSKNSPSGSQMEWQHPNGLKPTLFVNRPQFMRNDDEGDNELMSKVSPSGSQREHKPPGLKSTLFVNRPQVVQNDDEGDDELVYLGDLLKHHKMDRFRDHELPEIRGRSKPGNNGGFLPVN